MTKFTLAAFLFLISSTTFASIGSFTPGDIRTALLVGIRLDDLVRELETTPQKDRLERLIAATAFKFPPHTLVTHFADAHWTPQATLASAIRSYQVQRAMLTWWSKKPSLFFSEVAHKDMYPEHAAVLRAHNTYAD